MGEETNNNLPDYEAPPVAEVVCGIQFKPIKGLAGPYLGALWEKYKPEYPIVKEVEPIVPVIESYEETPSREMASFEGIFGLLRTWFETKAGDGLIQVQRDRFLHNWKKGENTTNYPHYVYVIGNFRKCLATFEAFLRENNLGEIQPTQFELTYVNHIFEGEGWKSLDDIGSVFKDFFRKPSKRFLPQPEIINWQTSFRLPDKTGRLHVSTRIGKRKSDGVPAILLEITARGISVDNTRDAMWHWFDVAHEWIVCGFADLTSDEIQATVWRRTR